MAIGGGGSGGGPVGVSNSFTGKAEALEVNGDFAYAYNQQAMSADIVPVFEFTTGNYLFKGLLQFTGPTEFTAGEIASGEISGIEFKLNGGTVAYLKSETAAEDMPMKTELDVIIPPYTDVIVNLISPSNNADKINSISFVGRVYR